MNSVNNQAHSSNSPLLRQSLWFDGLPPQARQQLLRVSTLRHLGAGQHLFLRGDPFDGIYCVLSGNISVVPHTAGADEDVLFVMSPPYWFGEIALFDRLPRTSSAYAVEPTVLLHLIPSAIEEMFTLDPLWAFRFGTMLAQKTRALFYAFEAQARLDILSKVARFIVMMSTQVWSAAPLHVRRELRFNQATVAKSLSTTRQTVAPAMKKLEDMKIIQMGYGKLRVIDWEKLCNIAQVDVAIRNA